MNEPVPSRLPAFLSGFRPQTDKDEIQIIRRLRNFMLGPIFGRVSREFMDVIGIDHDWADHPLHWRWENALEEERRLWIEDYGIVGIALSVRHLGMALGCVQVGGVKIANVAQVQEHFPDLTEMILESRAGTFLCTTASYFLTVQAVQDYSPDDYEAADEEDEFLDKSASWCEVDGDTWRNVVLEIAERHRAS